MYDESPANAGREPRRWQPRGLATTGVGYHEGLLTHRRSLPRGFANTQAFSDYLLAEEMLTLRDKG